MPASLSKNNSGSSDHSPTCFHCGEDCTNATVQLEEKSFCCEGCKMVYEILTANELGQYYEIDNRPGTSQRDKSTSSFAFLDAPEVVDKLIEFTDGKLVKVHFFLPQIHCASCIWLLENLYRLHPGVLSSKVNFLKRELFITYDASELSLRAVVELLSRIGYEPMLNLNELESGKKPVADRSFYYKIAIAGFAFGNIMLLSFPEYLGLNHEEEGYFARFFGYLNIALSLPVLLYSAQDYLRSAWFGLKQGHLNIDVPISLGILALFGRSAYEILSHTGAGYLDSMAGLVFFLLIGKWFQLKTYHHLSFERDYKSYFPVAATKKTASGKEESVTLDQLKPGDIILVKHQELIPADGILLKGNGHIDYSFVSGESEPTPVRSGQKVYAGGRQTGTPIELSLTRKVSQSYLTELWNEEAFTQEKESGTTRLADTVGRYFTITVLIIAALTFIYWFPRSIPTAINAVSAVLIIACPCAVALAIPFIFGNILRILGRHQFYLKNITVVEDLAQQQTVVFDKTGTLTQRNQGSMEFTGIPLNLEEQNTLRSMCYPSSHPVSQQLYHQLSIGSNGTGQDLQTEALESWEEITGKGVQGIINGKHIKIGAPAFMDALQTKEGPVTSGVYVQVDQQIRGYFRQKAPYRPGIQQVLHFFKERNPVFLLSGDHDGEKENLSKIFGNSDTLFFKQSPKDKLNFVKKLQAEGQKVMMFGDGLNDAGALKQSDVGIVITENANNFTPASDGIMSAAQFAQIPQFIKLCRRSIMLIYMAYALAFVYNFIGLSFAVQGLLSPVIAAILMPLSSISIILFGLLSTQWLASFFKLK